MSTITMLIHWWTSLSDDKRMMTSLSSPIAWTWVMPYWIVYAFILYHFAFIFLAINNGITFTDAQGSTNKLCTLKLNISKVNKKGGQRVFASIIKSLSTYSREPKYLQYPLFEKVALPVVVFPSARRRMFYWLVIFINSNIEMFTQIFFMSSTML